MAVDLTENKSNKSQEREENPGPPDCESDTLTSRHAAIPLPLLTLYSLEGILQYTIAWKNYDNP